LLIYITVIMKTVRL